MNFKDDNFDIFFIGNNGGKVREYREGEGVEEIY